MSPRNKSPLLYPSIQQLSLVSWAVTWSMPPPQSFPPFLPLPRCTLRPPLCYQHPPAPLPWCFLALGPSLALPNAKGSSSLLPQHHHPPGTSSGALHDFGSPHSLTSRRKSLFESVKTHTYTAMHNSRFRSWRGGKRTFQSSFMRCYLAKHITDNVSWGFPFAIYPQHHPGYKSS